MVHLDKRRLNGNFAIVKETEDVQLLSASMRMRVKEVGFKNVRLKVK